MTTDESNTGFDFFEAGELPVPLVSAEMAERWAEERLASPCAPSTSAVEQDANFLLVDASRATMGRKRSAVAVMKISNSAFDIQSGRGPGSRGPVGCGLRMRVCEPRRGCTSLLCWRRRAGGGIVRRLRYLDGGTLHGSGYLSPATVAEIIKGRVCGEVSAALVNLATTPAERVLQWDLRQGARVVDFLAQHIADADLRKRVTRVTRAEARRGGTCGVRCCPCRSCTVT